MRAIAVFFFALLVTSCGKQFNAPSDGGLADVTFFNESSYSVSVHLDNFGGTPIIDKDELPTGGAVFISVYPSNNHGAGSVFSIKYWYPVIDNCDDCWTSAIDPNAQITQNIESGETYVISIPEPKNLEGTEAFFRISNTSGNSIEFNKLSVTYRQLNGELTVPRGQTGVYRIEGEIDEYYTITQGFEKYPIPTFTAEKGYMHDFEFDGEEVISKGKQKIGEQKIQL